MIKDVVVNDVSSRIIDMKDMKPLDVGVIYDKHDGDTGTIVMRTANRDAFEVMDMSNPRVDGFWNGILARGCYRVRLFPVGTEITFKVA